MALEQRVGQPGRAGRRWGAGGAVAEDGGGLGELLGSGLAEEQLQELREHGRTRRPLGDEKLVGRLEGLVGRLLEPKKGGRPRAHPNR